MASNQQVAAEMCRILKPRPLSVLLERILPLSWQWTPQRGYNRFGLWLACRSWEDGEYRIAKRILEARHA